MMNSSLEQLWSGFIRGMVGTWRYGYFAPLQALFFFATRPRGYLWHLKALYRLCFGK